MKPRLVPVSSFIDRGIIKKLDMQATGNITLYVSSTGSDSNDGTTAATALASIQAAADRLAFEQQYNTATISIGAGTFSRFTVANRAVGYRLNVTGTTALSTLATGVNAGTASAGGVNYFDKPAGEADWTVDDLQGRWAHIVGGTGNGLIYPIRNNTASRCYLVPTNTTYDATTQFQIREPATIVSPEAGYYTANATQVQAHLYVQDLDFAATATPAEDIHFIAESANNTISVKQCKFQTSSAYWYNVPIAYAQSNVFLNHTTADYPAVRASYFNKAFVRYNFFQGCTSISGDIFLVRGLDADLRYNALLNGRGIILGGVNYVWGLSSIRIDTCTYGVNVISYFGPQTVVFSGIGGADAVITGCSVGIYAPDIQNQAFYVSDACTINNSTSSAINTRGVAWYTNAVIAGTGNMDYGYLTTYGDHAFWNVLPTVTGAGGDIAAGGSVLTYAINFASAGDAISIPERGILLRRIT